MTKALELVEEEVLPREFRRGQDFRFPLDLPNKVKSGQLTGWTLAAQLRRLDNTGPSGLIATLDVSWVASTGETQVMIEFDGDTSDWPVGPAEFDVLFTSADGTKKRRSNPIRIDILAGVTQ